MTDKEILQKRMVEEEKRNDYKDSKSNEIKKRKDFYQLRPPACWNFFDDAPEAQQAKHVLRANANPLDMNIYADGRIEKIWNSLEAIGINLAKYE